MSNAPQSTTQKGNAFRDLVNDLLIAAGFENVEGETRSDFKKVNAIATWANDTLDGRLNYLIETKDYTGPLPKQECINFVIEYGTLIKNGRADRAWLIARDAITPDGKALIHENRRFGLNCFTLLELQRHLLQMDRYLRDLIKIYNRDRISEYYVPPKTTDDKDIEKHVRDWISNTGGAPLAIVGAYGTGKSTFALHLAGTLAIECLKDPTKRAPILISLGDIVDEQTIDGLIGKLFASVFRVGKLPL